MNPAQNLSNKTDEELEQMLLRHTRLLDNKSLLLSLPDKGLKMKGVLKKIREEIEHRKSIDEIALSFSSLMHNDKNLKQRPEDLDSDDDWPEEPSQMHTEDPSSEVSQDIFAQQRTQKVQDGVAPSTNPFRLNQTRTGPPRARHNLPFKPSEEADELSALSPVFTDTPAQLLTLSESIVIQKDQDTKLKEAEKARNVERIYERFGPSIETCDPAMVEQLLYTTTREKEDGEDEDSSSESDVSDGSYHLPENIINEEDENWVEQVEDTLNELLSMKF